MRGIQASHLLTGRKEGTEKVVDDPVLRFLYNFIYVSGSGYYIFPLLSSQHACFRGTKPQAPVLTDKQGFF